jgi:DNA-binding CsgD family transcriptional regulator
VEPGLVGRTREIAVVSDAARALADGSGGFVHVVGEAGIGKTSLLSVAVEQLERRGVEVRAQAADETDRRRRLALIRSLFPELRRRPDPDPAGRAIAVLERLAAAGPVAVLADDVHWADDASVDALAAIARRVTALGALLVTSARPHPTGHALRRLEDAAVRDGRRLALQPLGHDELAALVEGRLGAPPGPDLVALLAGTAGNPFLAVELVSGLVDEDQLVLAGGTVELQHPSGMPDDLVDRLARRALVAVPDGQLVLRAATVLPAGFTAEELAAMLDRPLTDVLTVALAAVSAGVFVDTGVTLAFRHELLRRAVLESTPPSIVRTLYRRAAAVLTARRADPERITTCLLAGCDPDDPGDVDSLLSAATSLRASNPGASADLLRHALDGISPDDEASTATTLELGWALLAAGRAGEVSPLLRDRLGHLVGPLPIELQRLEGLALSLAGRPDEAAARYEGMDVDRLADQYGADDPELVDAAAELALLRVTTGNLAEARRLVEWVEAAPTPASAFRRASLATARAWLAGVDGAFEAAATQARAALEAVAEDDTGAATVGSPTLALGIVLDGLGDGEGALATFRRGESLGRAPRWAPPLFQLGAALTLFRRGEWDDALAEVDAGLMAADEADLGLGVFWPYAVGTLISCARGQLARAREWLERSAASGAPRALGMEWLVYASAMVDEAEGRTDAAAEALVGLARATVGAGAPALLLNSGPDAVRLAIATGRIDAATRVASDLVELTTRTASPTAAAIAAWARALVAPDAARLDDAAGVLAAHHRVPEAARARHDAAVAAATSGDEIEARRLAKVAFAAYEELGAEQLHARLRAELRVQGLAMRPRRSAPRPAHGWGSLTASEQTIVDLVGQGLTNTDIAERLFVSRRTVESHLGRVYDKLELSTRAQLVASVARRRAGDG